MHALRENCSGSSSVLVILYAELLLYFTITSNFRSKMILSKQTAQNCPMSQSESSSFVSLLVFYIFGSCYNKLVTLQYIKKIGFRKQLNKQKQFGANACIVII